MTHARATHARAGWQLWIDGCGGYRLLDGDRWTVGGAVAAGSVEIAVLADWPRQAGWIEREGDDFFWQPVAGERILLGDDQTLPIAGSAQLRFVRPSRLCGSAALRVMPPHRLCGHVDGVLLFHQTLLMGPGSDCHVRWSAAEQTVVLTRRQHRWLAKPMGRNAIGGSAANGSARGIAGDGVRASGVNAADSNGGGEHEGEERRGGDWVELTVGTRRRVGNLALTLSSAGS